MKSLRGLVVGAAVAITTATAIADSVAISFMRITSNAAENVELQFVSVLSTVTGQPGMVDFTFTNNVGTASSISEIYFDTSDSPSEFASGAILLEIGTNFSFGGANPSNLPGGNTLTTPFNATELFSSGAVGNPVNGINTSSDSLTIRFTLSGSLMFADIVDAIESGALRIGLHVRSIGANEESDGFVNMPPVVVPLPSASMLGFAGLGVLVGRRPRR